MTGEYPVVAAAGPGAIFEFEDLTFAVEGRRLVGPVTGSIGAGRVVALIGHNGSGKSTLLRLLARQQPATSGSLRFGGRPLADWRGRDLARSLAYLPQQAPAAAGLSVRDLVALGRYPWHGALGRFGAGDRDKVAEALDLTGLAPFADRLVDTLSGGERQRAWLAMLIAQDAACLLLDEPTSALDVAHQIEVLALIRSLVRARGFTVLVVLHDINMAARYADEILALKAGRLVTRGRPAEVVSPICLEQIFGVSMDVIPHPVTGLPVSYVR